MDLLNFYTLVVILLVNLTVGSWIFTKRGGVHRTNKVVDILWAHGLWTGTWLFWLFAWAVIWSFQGKGLLAAVILEDIGTILLLGSSVAYIGGWSALKKYALIPFILFVLVDIVWPMTVIIPKGWKPPGDLLTNTVLFAPSLCLVVFAIGLMAWSFLHLSEKWDLTAPMAFLAGGYALLQVVIYQANLFTPGGLHISDRWSEFLLVWRTAFVLFYWLIILVSAGVDLPLRRILAHAGWLGPVIASAVLQYLQRRGK